MKLRTALLGLSALFIASAAAFFSVTGLSKLFAGASTAVILMASSLEFGKLIAASFLYAYWDKVNKVLRTYLLLGVCVLILITSAGIYGFLTSAYQTTADQLDMVDKQTELVELKKGRFQEQLDGYNIEKQQLAQSISELSKGLSNNVIQYKDKDGNLITTTSSATRKALESQLNDAKSQREFISKKIETLSDSITKLDLSVLDIQQSSEVAGEVGPLKFMAEATGKPMNTIVNWFALLIIFVFDPLAVTLVIAFNTALKIDKGEYDKKKVIQKRELYGEEPDEKKTQKEALVEMMQTDEELGLYDEPFDEAHALDMVMNNMVSDLSEEDIKTIIESNDNPSEPNEVLVEAAETYKETTKPIVDELSDLKKDITRRGIDIDGDGTIDGYDNTGDGLIDEFVPKSSRRAQYAKIEKPYYAKPNFNWGDRRAWINDQNAVNYWLTYVKNDKDTSYPTDFDSKTY